ncbi:MAG: sensor histidine kinase N-terminal domain-containing protein [Gemmobacter sp.]
MTAYSLRRRLLLWLLLATAVLGLVALVDTWREAVRTAQGLSDRVLAGSALAIAERVTVDQDGGLEVDIPYSALEMLASTAEDQVFYRVDGPGGQFLTGYDSLVPVTPGPDGLGFADVTHGDVAIRSATLLRQVSTGAESIPYTVTVAESTLARDALARAILLRSALRLMALIGAVAAVVWLAVTLALRPLDRLGRAIAQRTPADLRALTAPVPAEAAPLVGAINSFMTRLDTALAALRHFTGNASHQLRTPLATLRTHLVLARRATGRAQAEHALAKADAALVRAERVLAQLLALARVDAAASGGGLVPVDLVLLARGVAEELLPLAHGRGIDLGFEGPTDAVVLAEPVLAGELLRNLLDNALAYAGPGAVVTARVRPEANAVHLEVEDNGPGLPPGRLPLLGTGAPRKVATGGEGYGLGLSIVTEIATLFGATCTFVAGAGGRGLLVRCTFAVQAAGQAA